MTGERQTGEREILPAGPVHAGVLAALHALAFRDPAPSGPAWDEAAFANLLAMPGVEGWILTEGGAPRALALWRMVLDEAELLTIGTDPAARGHGLGRALLAQGLHSLTARGVAKIFLEVAVINTAAIALYASAGFIEAGRRRGYYQHGGQSIDALIMMLEPPPP
ncbi:GNAT family N-acetyltransferase [Niveispirillum fermenti]|uniref:GNAT family N-acetyltransferase n=1 Tax=Niveispirillum fermenti TaxID=1233113 RepID=UPI003A851F23